MESHPTVKYPNQSYFTFSLLSVLLVSSSKEGYIPLSSYSTELTYVFLYLRTISYFNLENRSLALSLRTLRRLTYTCWSPHPVVLHVLARSVSGSITSLSFACRVSAFAIWIALLGLHSPCFCFRIYFWPEALSSAKTLRLDPFREPPGHWQGSESRSRQWN